MKVSYNGLKKISGEIEQLGNNFQEQIDNLKGIKINSFLEGNIENYFSSILKNFISEYEELITDIKKSSSYLMNVVNNYESVDSKINTMVENIKISNASIGGK